MQTRTKIVMSAAAIALVVLAPKVRAITPTLVQVVNNLSQWVPTASVDEPGRNPIEATLNITADDTSTEIYQVPDGFRLVIKQISALCLTQTPVVSGVILTTVGGTRYGGPFAMCPTAKMQSDPTLQESVGSIPVEYFADPGTRVLLGMISVNGFGATGACQATIAGYLVALVQPN
ncbi:MAG TPA: hypothetical protein VME43_24935 [Bryobacteraceae bacterium]|nr:hypothetical protein [Bryobacteraceae bacterium]